MKRLFSKDTGLGRFLFGYDIIKVTEILKPTQLNNSWGDRRNDTNIVLNLLLLQIHAYCYLIASPK